jgi:hypothetical protein
VSEQASTAPDVHGQRMQTVQDALALTQELQPLLQGDATVLCHNDLLCGNILQQLGGDRLYLIDYECDVCSLIWRVRVLTSRTQIWGSQRCSFRHRQPLQRVAGV